jgi:hypothetical protein
MRVVVRVRLDQEQERGMLDEDHHQQTIKEAQFLENAKR